MYKKRLYYAHLDSQKKRKTFPYLFCTFSHQSDIKNMSYKIREPININGVGTIQMKIMKYKNFCNQLKFQLCF